MVVGWARYQYQARYSSAQLAGHEIDRDGVDLEIARMRWVWVMERQKGSRASMEDGRWRQAAPSADGGSRARSVGSVDRSDDRWRRGLRLQTTLGHYKDFFFAPGKFRPGKSSPAMANSRQIFDACRALTAATQPL